MKLKRIIAGIVIFTFAIILFATNASLVIDEANSKLSLNNLIKLEDAKAEGGSSITCYNSIYYYSGYYTTYCLNCSIRNGYGYGGASTCN